MSGSTATILWVCLLLGVLGLMVAGSVVGILRARKTSAADTTTAATISRDKVARMLPRCRRERRYWALLALSAGICEEVVWRGFLLVGLIALFPGQGARVYVLASALVFGCGHLYQGAGGMLASGFIGAVFTVLYLLTGSLWLVMLLHTLIDLHPLLLSSDKTVVTDGPDSQTRASCVDRQRLPVSPEATTAPHAYPSPVPDLACQPVARWLLA